MSDLDFRFFALEPGFVSAFSVLSMPARLRTLSKRFHLDLRDGAFRDVVLFTVRHWSSQPARLALIMTAILTATLADMLTPLYSGRLVDIVARGDAMEAIAWNAALAAFSTLVALGLVALAMRYFVSITSAELTLQMMSDVTSDGFHRVQRFSADWHANSFTGSTVRKISRGMRALELLNYTILDALFPSLIMLVGSTVLLGWHWPMMGLIVAGGSLVYLAVTGIMSLRYVAAAASLCQQVGHKAWRCASGRNQLQHSGEGFRCRSSGGPASRQDHRQVAAPRTANLGTCHHQRHSPKHHAGHS